MILRAIVLVTSCVHHAISTCSQPQTPEHATLIFEGNTNSPSQLTNGSVVRIVCDELFRLVEDGDGLMTCANGQWSATFTCAAICDRLPHFPRGTITYSNGDTIARYSCTTPGYRLEGIRERKCTSNGTWSDERPRCRVIPQTSCDNSRLPGNLLVANETQGNGSTTSGRWLRVRCESHSRMLLGPFLMCRNGHWKGNAFCIREECPNLSPPENGEKFGSNYGYNEEVSFTCNDGFILDGVLNLRCQRDLTWSSPPPICKAISEVCTMPQDPANGQWIRGFNCRDGQYQLQGCQLTYTCNERYTPANNNVVYVCSEPEWDQMEAPLCESVFSQGSCDNSNLPFPGMLARERSQLQSFTANGNFISVQCEGDLRLMSGHFLLCENGRWKGNSYCIERK